MMNESLTDDRRYRVNEIFLSVQGEGTNTGMPAVFLRLAGCNLRCPFCDTDHVPFTPMTAAEILLRVGEQAGEVRTVVITGGEPALQLDSRLVGHLKQAGYTLHIETNGTLPLPDGIDWITCSPKGAPLRIGHIDELKVVYDATERSARYAEEMASLEISRGAALRLQPCTFADPARTASTIRAAVDYILSHPRWRLSLQTHKLIDIP
ncbi:MAG: 7-carboxy-7-deazaguanine synthase QueE [Clostridium sp.]|nr:7-carboxy-7-deazaguanine synthase QueE [Clostridium sp.]